MNKNIIQSLSVLFFICLNIIFFSINSMSLIFIFIFAIIGIAVSLGILNQEKEI